MTPAAASDRDRSRGARATKDVLGPLPTGNSSLILHNRQRVRPVNLRLLRRIMRALLGDLLRRDHFDLGIWLVGSPRMSHLNERFLQHGGSTDVITFDYRDPVAPDWLHGEIFVCLDEAVAQAQRFHATWQSELVRYILHGLLHLCDYDDRTPAARRTMKRAESRLLRQLALRFHFDRLGDDRPKRTALARPV